MFFLNKSAPKCVNLCEIKKFPVAISALSLATISCKHRGHSEKSGTAVQKQNYKNSLKKVRRLLLSREKQDFAITFVCLLSRENQDIAITFVCLSVCLFVC